MRIIQCDILTQVNETTDKIVILHGCNCHHRMGAGIAKYLRAVYPQVFTADVSQTKQSDRKKLGTYSVAKVAPNLHILNCYTQYDYKHYEGHAPVDYDAIRDCLKKVNIEYDGWEIRSPKIGCGLAGGDWDRVEQIFQEELNNQDVTIYYV